MKVVCISDTHTRHQDLEIPDGDVLIHAGDMTNAGSVGDIRNFNEWMRTLPHKHKLVIAGNHDWFFQKKPLDKIVKECNSFTYLQDESIVIDGIKFYGSPWQPEFGRWAFNLPRGEALKEKWDAIDDDTNVLITHGPPYGYCDLVDNGWSRNNGENVGCQDLLNRIHELGCLQYHVCGHIHSGHGIKKTTSGVNIVNASICNEEYRPDNKPLVFDIYEL